MIEFEFFHSDWKTNYYNEVRFVSTFTCVCVDGLIEIQTNNYLQNFHACSSHCLHGPRFYFFFFYGFLVLETKNGLQDGGLFELYLRK